MKLKTNPLDELLHDLPTPKLSETRKNELHTSILNYYDKVHAKEKKTKKQEWMKRLQISMGSLAGLALIALITISLIPHHTWTHSNDGKTTQTGTAATVHKPTDLSAEALGNWFVQKGITAPFAGAKVKRVSNFVMNLTTGTLIQPSKVPFNPEVSGVIDQWEGDINSKPFVVDLYQNIHTKDAFVGVRYNHKVVAAYSCQAKDCIVHNFTGSYIVFEAPNRSGHYFSINVRTGEVIPSSKSQLNMELAGVNPNHPTQGANWITGLSQHDPFKPSKKQTTSSASQSNQSNPFKTSLTLPNGTTVVPNQSVKWKGLTLQVMVTSLPVQSDSGDKYMEILGNQSTVKRHETVQTSIGKADLVWNERSQPAASTSQGVTDEYWLIRYGSQYAYAIEATFKGDPKAVRTELLHLSQNWEVPK